MKQIYLCSDTVTGLYSALHDAWKENRDSDAGIEIRGSVQRQLFCSYVDVEESDRKAVRLEKMIKNNLGDHVYRQLYFALLSEDAEKGTAVFRTLQASRKLKDSRKVMDHLGDPDVARVFFLSRTVSNEAHLYEGFVRFRELQNGVLFSEISPKAQILTCIGDHFAERFPLENWMIRDKTHHVSLMHRAGENWHLVWGGEPDRASTDRVSESQKEYERLWKRFFDSIAVSERNNPVCQRNHLPMRFRREMPEF